MISYTTAVSTQCAQTLREPSPVPAMPVSPATDLFAQVCGEEVFSSPMLFRSFA